MKERRSLYIDTSLFSSNLFVSALQEKKDSGAIDTADKEILAEAERLDVKAMGPLILSELLFDENIREQIKKYKRHFLRVCPCSRWHF